jgi:cyclohexa-1,5-dienecarbonyl-CoA hydratase
MMATVLPETHRIIKRLLAFPACTAALVEGRCLGGGFELALACDDIIATDTAAFGLPEIRLAAFPPAAAALLPLRVGASRAARAIVTGQQQDARYWHDAGLLSMVAPQSSLADAAAGWFDTHLAPHSAVALSHAIAAARLTLRAQAEPALDRAERDYLGGLLKTKDAVEGVKARWRSVLQTGKINSRKLKAESRNDRRGCMGPWTPGCGDGKIAGVSLSCRIGPIWT